MSFLAGLTRGIQNGMQLAEKQRQEEGLQKLIDLLDTQETESKRTKTANSAYDFSMMDPTKKVPVDYKFNDSLTGEVKPVNTMVQGDTALKSFGLGDMVQQPKPSYRETSLPSLLPTSRQAEPTYDSASMYGLLKKAVAAGVSPALAMQVVPGFYAGKQAEAEKAKNLAEYNNLISGINENTSPIDLIKGDAQLRAKGHPGLNGYALTDLIKLKQAKGFIGQNGPEQPQYYGSSTNAKTQPKTPQQQTAQPESGEAWYAREWQNAYDMYKNKYPDLPDEQIKNKAYSYMTYYIKANGG